MAKIDITTRQDFQTAMAMDARINATAFRVGFILLSHRNGKTELICPSHQTLAREAGCSPSAVKRSIRALVEAGRFKVENQFRDNKQMVNRYEPVWDQIDRSPMPP